ncbi:MAG: TetR/AcrR family transcriptional regulator [Pseudomonadota bacterium]
MPKASAAPIILKAAEACLIAGNGTFEMRAVTDRAGVSEGLVYHYFKSKAGLMTAIVTAYYDRYAAVANRHVDRDVPWLEREETRLRDVVNFLYTDPLTRTVQGGLNRLPDAARAELENRRDIAERSIRNIQSGQDQGVIPDWVDATIAGPATIGAMDQAVMYALSQDDPPPQDSVTAEIWRIICAIVGADH